MLRRERLNLGAEQALYRPIFEGMNPELSQFYQSLRKREQREERDRLERERRKEEEERRREEEQVGVIEPTSPVGIIEPSSPVPSYVEPPRSPSPPPAIPPESVLPQPSRHKDVKFRQILQNSFKTTSQIVFQEYVSHQPKSVVVGSFLSILASAAQSFIKVTQAEPYADIVITPTEKLLSERFTRGEEVPAV